MTRRSKPMLKVSAPEWAHPFEHATQQRVVILGPPPFDDPGEGSAEDRRRAHLTSRIEPQARSWRAAARVRHAAPVPTAEQAARPPQPRTGDTRLEDGTDSCPRRRQPP